MSSRFSMITGQGGVGKSTALVQYLSDYCNEGITSNRILYVQADHFVTAKYSLYEIAESFVDLGGEIICFDEVHKHENWAGELKSIYDTFPGLKMITSGSSILEIHKGTHDLSRRAVVYSVAGLSFREFIELVLNIDLPTVTVDDIINSHEEITRLIIEKVENCGRKILPLFNDYLKFGYYPYFLNFENISLFHITLEQQIHTTIESDLAAVYRSLTGESIRKLKKLLAVIARNIPFTPDMTRLMKIINVGDARTLKSYLKYLEDGCILMQFGKSGKLLGSLEKPEKIYLNNTNQLFALAGFNESNRGTVRETFFANMLSYIGSVVIPGKGDFLYKDELIFEVGGKNKTRKQIAGVEKSYLALDNMENGFGDKIPLWIFGFIY